MSASTDPFDRFWAFSLDRYARAGVGETCLTLQDTLCADVNIVLLCLWSSQEGRQLERSTLIRIVDSAAGRWHRDVVVPIRSARRAMKGRMVAGDGAGVAAVREQLKAIEIACEKLEQQQLCDALGDQLAHAHDVAGGVEARRDLARDNLKAYVDLLAPDAAHSGDSLIDRLAGVCVD